MNKELITPDKVNDLLLELRNEFASYAAGTHPPLRKLRRRNWFIRSWYWLMGYGR